MKIEGVIPALPTPFTSTGQLDEIGLARLVQHVAAGGVHGLWALGSTSEFPSLSRSQRDRIVEICVQQAEGRIPIIVGVGDLDERVIIKNSEEAEPSRRVRLLRYSALLLHSRFRRIHPVFASD